MLESITPVILTLNEAPNIARTLAALSWASDVVVVDSASDDGTREIAASHRNVRLFTRPFDEHATQWNFAIGQTGIATEWILALDADYVISKSLTEELRALKPPKSVSGYFAAFQYCVEGKALRGSVYPPVVVLYRRGSGTYEQDGHTQRLKLNGLTGRLSELIRHDDRKPLSSWFAAQSRYTDLEAKKLAATPFLKLSLPDRIRTGIVLAPPLVFLYALFVKGAILDGRSGLYYALQRFVAELMLSLQLVRSRIGRSGSE